jgi:hypothetical protein
MLTAAFGILLALFAVSAVVVLLTKPKSMNHSESVLLLHSKLIRYAVESGDKDKALDLLNDLDKAVAKIGTASLATEAMGEFEELELSGQGKSQRFYGRKRIPPLR